MLIFQFITRFPKSFYLECRVVSLLPLAGAHPHGGHHVCELVQLNIRLGFDVVVVVIVVVVIVLIFPVVVAVGHIHDELQN